MNKLILSKIVKFIIILVYLLMFYCSSRNNSYYQNQIIIPEYNLNHSSNFKNTKTVDTSSYPLESSTFSFYQLKEAIDNSNYPSQVYTEELLNHFSYNYPKYSNQKNLNIYSEIATSPWNPKNKLVHIGIYSPNLETEKKDIPTKNIIFAVDTSGSMSGYDRLELAKTFMKNFIQTLQGNDTVSIIQFTTDAKIVLNPTNINAKNKILDSISRLTANGGTDIWPGILLSYRLTKEIKNLNVPSKVILITDGDFGGVNDNEFFTLIDREKKSGTSFSAIGFGKDLGNVSVMDKLSNLKLAETFYIRSSQDLYKFSLDSSWQPIKSLTSDMKVEVKFNRNNVESFRLIGFENFKQVKDAKNYNAYSGFSYTALYEILPAQNTNNSLEMVEIKLKYKSEKGTTEEIKQTVQNNETTTWESTEDFRFAAGVAGLAMLINKSIHRGNVDFNMVIHLLQSSLAFDPDGTRKELFILVNKIKNL